MFTHRTHMETPEVPNTLPPNLDHPTIQPRAHSSKIWDMTEMVLQAAFGGRILR